MTGAATIPFRIMTIAISIAMTGTALPHSLAAQVPASPVIPPTRTSIDADYNNPMTVSGIVTDDNHQPIVGAHITIDALGVSIGSDRAGVFRVKVSRPGMFVFKIRAIGYMAISDTMTLTADAGVRTHTEMVIDPRSIACSLVITGNPGPAKKP